MIADMPINNKKLLKNLLLHNQKPYDFETWHEASGREDLLYKVYINHYSGVTLPYFMARST